MHKFKELLFGTAGIPISTNPRNTENGIQEVKKLGLGCMELEFVHSVNISKEKAPSVKKIAEDTGIVLSCHGQYYINLNAQDPKKYEASKQRMLNAARIVNLVGGFSVCFHPGIYMGVSKEEAYAKVKKGYEDVINVLHEEGNKVWVAAETTGKPTQVGSLEEILQMCQEVEGMGLCVDYGHLHARTNGKNNTYDEFCGILDQIETALGKEALQRMHIQVAGIEYSEKGERRHLTLTDHASDLNYKDLVRSWKEYDVKGVVIAETPDVEKGSLLLFKTYQTV